MKIKYYLLALIGLCSCTNNVNFDDYDINLHSLFNALGNDIQIECDALQKDIAESEKRLLENSLYLNYRQHTLNYVEYLDLLEKRSLKTQSNLFFVQGEKLPEADVFLKKSSNYLDSIKLSSNNPHLNGRIKLLLGIEDRKVEE